MTVARSDLSKSVSHICKKKIILPIVLVLYFSFFIKIDSFYILFVNGMECDSLFITSCTISTDFTMGNQKTQVLGFTDIENPIIPVEKWAQSTQQKGATVESKYTPSVPEVVIVKTQVYKDENSDSFTCFLGCCVIIVFLMILLGIMYNILFLWSTGVGLALVLLVYGIYRILKNANKKNSDDNIGPWCIFILVLLGLGLVILGKTFNMIEMYVPGIFILVSWCCVILCSACCNCK